MHNAQNLSENKIMDVTQLVGEIDGDSLEEELETSKHPLVDSKWRIGDIEFNFAMEILDADTLCKKLDTVFVKLKCAGKLNVAFGFLLKNVEDGTYRYYYTDENNTLMEWSKFVQTNEDLVRIKNVLSNTDVIEACTKRANTKWKLYKIKNVNDIAALLREVPMGYKNAALPEPITKNHTVNRLTYEQNTENRTGDLRKKLQKRSIYF